MKRLQNKTNVAAPDADWPYGDLKNDSGTGDGTPVDKELITDIQQTFEKIFDESGLTANGLPDNETNGFQLYEAIRTLFPMRQKIVEIGSWDMDATLNVNVPHGLTLSKIRDVRVTILDDSGNPYRLNIDVGAGVSGSSAAKTTNVEMTRTSSGFFDSTDFNDAGINRGYILIDYVD